MFICEVFLHFLLGVLNSFLQFPDQLLSNISISFSIILGIVFLLSKYPTNFHYFGFERNKLRATIVWGIICGLIVSLLWCPYDILRGEGDFPIGQYVNIQSGKYIILFYLVSVAFIAPFLEEIFLRGCLYRLLRDRFDVFWGWLLSTGYSVLRHSMVESEEVLSSFIFSSLMTYLYQKTKSIGTCIIVHILVNTSYFGAIYLYNFGLIGNQSNFPLKFWNWPKLLERLF